MKNLGIVARILIGTINASECDGQRLVSEFQNQLKDAKEIQDQTHIALLFAEVLMILCEDWDEHGNLTKLDNSEKLDKLDKLDKPNEPHKEAWNHLARFAESLIQNVQKAPDQHARISLAAKLFFSHRLIEELLSLRFMSACLRIIKAAHCAPSSSDDGFLFEKSTLDQINVAHIVLDEVPQTVDSSQMLCLDYLKFFETVLLMAESVEFSPILEMLQMCLILLGHSRAEIANAATTVLLLLFPIADAIIKSTDPETSTDPSLRVPLALIPRGIREVRTLSPD